MTTFYMIRHGEPDYRYGDAHGFIGHGHDLAPLSQKGREEVLKTARDPRLKQAQIILSSPYTRALQTAAIIAKKTGLDILVESDLMEWQADLTYQIKNFHEVQKQYADYLNYEGIYPKGERKTWESREQVEKRMRLVIDQYKDTYDTIIVVSHQTAMQALLRCGKIQTAQLLEVCL